MTPDTDWAFARYEAVRSRLPQADFTGQPRLVHDLSDTFDMFDGYILDAFGVLNRGETVIEGAIERVAQMRAAGKRLVVLTNGATWPRAKALEKYARLGFDFTPEEVIASRDLAAAALARWPEGMLWAAITAKGAALDDLPGRIEPLAEDETLLDRAEGFVFLGSEGWTPARQQALHTALARHPRPVIVANPDIVAPREDGFTLEPGHFAHDLPLWEQGQGAEFHGKPFADALVAALARLDLADPARVAMVGDTLHTDVLGGRAAGCGTVLITDHGLFRGHDPMGYIRRSGIWPDVIARTT